MTPRPAEVGGIAFAMAALLCRLAGVRDPEVITGLAMVAGAAPAVITLLVVNGGLRGTLRKLWRGRS